MQTNRHYLACKALAKRDLSLAFRSISELLNPIWFFIVVVSLFPLAISPQSQLLQEIAPGVIWVAALLANLLALDRLFRSDYEDGCIEQLILCPQPLSLLLATKIFVHWLLTGLPLVVISPVLAVLLHIPIPEIKVLMLSLLLGTPIFSLIGAIALALTVSLRGGGVLLAICVLPLSIPVLIFGAGSAVSVSQGLAPNGQLALLGAILLLSITFAPWAVSGALRVGVE